jgi:hypothetical protein
MNPPEQRLWRFTFQDLKKQRFAATNHMNVCLLKSISQIVTI